MNIKKRCFVRIISFLTAASIICAGFFVCEYNKRVYLKEQIANGYKESLAEFSALLSEINFGLKKQLYSSDDAMLSALSADIFKNSAAAKECLARLPISPENTDKLYKFLATAGDFSRAVAVSDTDEITEENKKQLKQLITFSDKLTEAVSTTSAELEESDSFTQDVKESIEKLENETAFSASVEDITEIADGVPTLIYDGPFSDHVNRQEAKLLAGKSTVSKSDALKKAEEYLGEKNLKYCCDENSATESYIFEGQNSVCAITKKGGYCLYMNKEVESSKTSISANKAVENAKNYLNKITGLTFCESYYTINENVMTVNLAFCENNIIFYPDLIKVSVRMDNGDIIAVEARGFIMNHYDRTAYAYKNKIDTAKKVLSDQLKVQSSSKALISDDALNEIYCYEFICKATDGGDVIVYINEQTLKEENIFIIIHTEGGTLTY